MNKLVLFLSDPNQPYI